ncbi:tctex1 domain-containing protein 1-B-like [Huso huso]|uniref:Tctex1 domain-containing protein 1-B-like n=1 Tax=Huso huso TaxID=61971 RepID=A0ABR0ZHG5_HUSHU|nr:dynein light chain Tctex-type 4-like [Acipenser ruthenus]
MTTKQLPLSQETLAQFNQALAAESGGVLRTRAGSISTRRSSQSVDLHHPKHLLHLKSVEGSLSVIPSRRSSVFSNLNLTRKESLSLGKRLSLGPWMLSGRVSFSGLPLYQPVQETQFENTYKTHPDEGFRFDACKVQHLLEATLAGFLSDTRYNPVTCGQLTQNLSDLIHSKAKDLNPPRYKLVCHVILGQLNNQGLRVASRCLWDSDKDNFAVATFQNTSLFAVAMVHGLYCE